MMGPIVTRALTLHMPSSTWCSAPAQVIPHFSVRGRAKLHEADACKYYAAIAEHICAAQQDTNPGPKPGPSPPHAGLWEVAPRCPLRSTGTWGSAAFPCQRRYAKCRKVRIRSAAPQLGRRGALSSVVADLCSRVWL